MKRKFAYRVVTLLVTIWCCACTRIPHDAEGYPTASIAEFLAKDLNDSTEYILNGEIVSISDPKKGCLYLADESGLVYVYGLCSTRQESNDLSFKNLNLSVGDRLSLVSSLSEYKGRLEAGGSKPALYLHDTKGGYHGENHSLTEWTADDQEYGFHAQEWPEIPKIVNTDAVESNALNMLVHRLEEGGEHGKRSFTLCWDSRKMQSLWVAYPLYANSIGKGKRSDAWGFDPLLRYDNQPQISEYSYKKGNAGSFIRGHLIPSADRLSLRDNVKTFFVSNAVPQDNGLNSGIWQRMEKAMRHWASLCDTLYIVSGIDLNDGMGYVKDSQGRRFVVPGAFYKLAAAVSLSEGPLGTIAFYCENRKYDAQSGIFDCETGMQVIEEKTGFDYFPSLGDSDALWFHQNAP